MATKLLFTSECLHPAAIVAGGGQLLTELRRFRPRHGRQHDKAVPNAFAAEIDRLWFATVMAQELRISPLQIAKGASRDAAVPVGKDHRYETRAARERGGCLGFRGWADLQGFR